MRSIVKGRKKKMVGGVKGLRNGSKQRTATEIEGKEGGGGEREEGAKE